MRYRRFVVIAFLMIAITGTGVLPAPVRAQAEIISFVGVEQFGCGNDRYTGSIINFNINNLNTSQTYELDVLVKDTITKQWYTTRRIVQQPRVSDVTPFQVLIYPVDDLNKGVDLGWTSLPTGPRLLVQLRLVDSGTSTRFADAELRNYDCSGS